MVQRSSAPPTPNPRRVSAVHRVRAVGELCLRPAGLAAGLSFAPDVAAIANRNRAILTPCNSGTP
jgi:hypothetical protein